MVERDFADGTRTVFVNHPSGTSDVLLQLDGQQVSRVVIVPMLMRIGAAVVRWTVSVGSALRTRFAIGATPAA